MAQKLKPIMFVGTGSDVGKSIISSGFCRILKQNGFSPAPFKAQNMSLNSYVTPDGLEIGRAQAVQAEACKISCSVDMNPVLLKPTGNSSSQVVIFGKPTGNQSAKEYFLENNRQELFDEAIKGYYNLDKKYNPIVIEGAGSISELNLKDRDITNMKVAVKTNANVFLISDIERGGVFASVYGSVMLLEEEERKLIKGVIINKFKGDLSLFEEGLTILEKIGGVPVVGVIPYYDNIIIEDEDSVALKNMNNYAMDGVVNIVIPMLKYISNFTDFNVLNHLEGVNLYFSNKPQEISKADIIILPGSKNTIADMNYLRKKEIDKVILERHKAGKSIYGICGGFQIMGYEIHDPDGIESNEKTTKGLGLLPIRTILSKEKTTEQCTFEFCGESLTENKNNTKPSHSAEFTGYEIHMGQMEIIEGATQSPLCKILKDNDYKFDGYFKNEKIWGTYLHGIFDNMEIINHIINIQSKGKKQTFKSLNYNDFKNKQYDLLAEHLKANMDMEKFWKIIKS